jgi:hypothetical protein
MIPIKTKCILAFCHAQLIEAERQDAENKGFEIIKDLEQKQIIKKASEEIIRYCKKVGAVKEIFESYYKANRKLYAVYFAHYEQTIFTYKKYIVANNIDAIPVVYVFYMMTELQKLRMTAIDIDFTTLLEIIEKCDYLQGEFKESRFANGPMIRDRTIINTYSKCVFETIKEVLSSNIVKEIRKIKKARKK